MATAILGSPELVAKVMKIQRDSQDAEHQWWAYCAEWSPSGSNDPASHDDTFLNGFVEMLVWGPWMEIKPDITQEADRKSRSGGFKGGGKDGFSGKDSGGATVCITGAAGFVGSWLVKLCLERGYSVRACVRNVADDAKCGFLKVMPEYGSKLTLHAADMTVPGAYDGIFEGCTIVFHPAEVFMSFSNGRDIKRASQALLGDKQLSPSSLHNAATTTSQNIVDSINKCSTVTRLVYTSSTASMMGGILKFYHDNPAIDETREPEHQPPEGYAATKRLTEKFFDYASAASGGRWSLVIGNPSDIVGPILSAHQAAEQWQGKIAMVVQGTPSPQEPGGRPWYLVDVRDVALAEILLAESQGIQSGSRFLLSSGDKILGEDLGVSAMELHPEWDCATTVAPGVETEKVVRNCSGMMRVHLRNDRVRQATGMNFRTFDDTFKATIDSLVSVGGIKPRLKKM